MIPTVSGRSLNFNITQILCGQPLFPDYFSVSYDYAVCYEIRFNRALLKDIFHAKYAKFRQQSQYVVNLKNFPFLQRGHTAENFLKIDI